MENTNNGKNIESVDKWIRASGPSATQEIMNIPEWKRSISGSEIPLLDIPVTEAKKVMVASNDADNDEEVEH